MFGDKVFQTMVFSRHMQEASHCYENFGLEWSFKYSKNTMVSSKLWYSKQSFYTLTKHLTGKNTMVLFQGAQGQMYIKVTLHISPSTKGKLQRESIKHMYL
jgi:hypothetical protein